MGNPGQEELIQSQPASPPEPVVPAAEGPPPGGPGVFRRIHHFVKELEPWGILVGVAALLLSLLAFWIDYRDRVEERTVRAWQLLTTKAPGNSGKREALEYLNKDDGLFCFGGHCLLALKKRKSLVGVDLSVPEKAGVVLWHVQLPYADLRFSDLSQGQVQDANLTNARLEDSRLFATQLDSANLNGANLSRAELIKTNLRSADLRSANLRSAELSGADLRGANLEGADLTGARLTSWPIRLHPSEERRGTDLSQTNVSQEQLNAACGDEHTKLPEGVTVPPCAK